MNRASHFFSPEHAVARFRASRAADDRGLVRVRFSPPSTRTRKPTVMQILLRACPLFIAFIAARLIPIRRRRIQAQRRRS